MKVAELLEAFDRDDQHLLAKLLRTIPGVVSRTQNGEVHCYLDPELPGIRGFNIEMYTERRPFEYGERKPRLTVQWMGNHDPETGEIPTVKRWPVKDAEQAFDSIRAIINKVREQ